MFTGIITAVGKITALEPRDGGVRLRVNAGDFDMAGTSVGDSIAVNGVCLTVVAFVGDHFTADVSDETLRCTIFSRLVVGDAVNLEPALALGSRLGGHLVSGHVDAIGEVLQWEDAGESKRLGIRAPDSLAKYIPEKGSICVDGVSLTVNRVEGSRFECNIVPHTLRHTTIGEYAVGRPVNLEVDTIARYLERLLLGAGAAEPPQGITKEFLSRHGFIK